MATRFIHRGNEIPEPVSTAVGFGVDTDDRLKVNIAGIERPINHNFTEVITTSRTLTPEESGSTFLLNSTSSITLTLPATQVGLEYTFVVLALTTTGGHNFTPQSADKIVGYGLSKTDGQAVTCSAASDAVGDFLRVVGDGIDGWVIVGGRGTFA